MNTPDTFVGRLIEGYEKAKKSLAYIIMLIAITIESLPSDLLPKNISVFTNTAILIVLAMILMQILFTIYDKVTEEKELIPIITPDELLKEVHRVCEKEKRISIKYIAIAGRFGWNNVLAKLIDEASPFNLVGKDISLDIALLSPEYQKSKPQYFDRFTLATEHAIKEIEHAMDKCKFTRAITLNQYNHMPNLIGILVNNNFLFLSFARWGTYRSQFELRGGGASSYFIYDKNDEFGGDEMIELFNGWHEFYSRSNQTEHYLKSVDAQPN